MNLEKTLQCKTWDKRVNISILAICFVDTWKAYSNATLTKSTQREFYLRLSEELIDNTHGRIFVRNIKPIVGVPEDDDDSHVCLLASDGSVPSGLGIHLTPTKKRRRAHGKTTPYLKQGYCKVCKRKTKYICSLCDHVHDNDGKETFLCHTSTGRDCFLKHIRMKHQDSNTTI